MLDRRSFVAAGGAVLAASTLTADDSPNAEKKPKRFKKAVKFGMFRGKGSLAEKFQHLKDVGFDGVELSAPGGAKAETVLEAVEKTGLVVHGCVNNTHWRKTLSDPDPKVREAGLDALKGALRQSKSYGGTSVLLVPAVVNQKVTYGDAYKRSQAEIKKAIPLAVELGMQILLENVWNNFLLSPVETARYIDELNDGLKKPVVGAYFDVGNVVRYGWPTHWIQALGKRVVKLDVKEFDQKLHMKSGPWAGFRKKIGEGTIDWPGVVKALQKIGFSGWATAEVGGGDIERMKDIKARMDKVLPG